jgi:murein DD-endopeptidase MepM/ murein hydrolase activator NlpD
MKLLATSSRAPLGNYVILRHAGGEFSHYAHLKQGSVRVKAGDTVKQGQGIAQLGQTGNTTEPHLHFQLTDGPDPLYSRGVPIRFKNAVNTVGFSGSYLQTGWIVNGVEYPGDLRRRSMQPEQVIHSNPNILGGTPVFVGTRVPVQTLLDYLEGGDSLDTFLDHFPSVRREQAVAVLELAKRMLIAHARAA